MGATYYTLLERDWQGRWCAAAGSYYREEMEYELEDCAAATGQPKRAYKIIKTGVAQYEIDAAIAKLNGED